MALELKHRLDNIRKISDSLSKRNMEPLAVYRPMEAQLPIHQSAASEVIIRGGKRSGKTVASIMEFCSRVLGQPIIGPDGKPLPLRFPAPKVSDRRLYWLIGFNVDHIGQTLYPKLFEPGLFRIIQDKKTGEWRTFNQNDPRDAGRFSESVPAPPAIPQRFIDGPKSWHWETNAGNVFKSVELNNGAMLCAYPSTSDHAKQGDSVDGILIDEDIANGEFLDEWQDRLIDKDGWFLWSVWPHVANFALVETLERAAREAEDNSEKPDIEAFQLVTHENPFASAEGQRKSKRRRRDDEDEARRDYGELRLDTIAMYDFVPKLHTLTAKPPALDKPVNCRELFESLLDRFGRFPGEWTRYLSIDPGHTRTAVHSAVVPPDEWENVDTRGRVIIEWELVVQKHSAEKLAELLSNLMGSCAYEAFVMDDHAGRQTSIGRDDRTRDHYGKAFAARRLISRQTKSGFIPGCDVKSLRRREVRVLLDPSGDGLPRLFLVGNKTFSTQKEFRTFRKKQQKIGGETVILDEAANERQHDCMASIEYLVAYLATRFADGSAHVQSEESTRRGSTAYYAAMALQAKLDKQAGGSYVHLGPGVAA